MEQLISQVAVMTRRRQHEITAQLIQHLHVASIGAIHFEHHLSQHRAGIGKQ